MFAAVRGVKECAGGTLLARGAGMDWLKGTGRLAKAALFKFLKRRVE